MDALLAGQMLAVAEAGAKLAASLFACAAAIALHAIAVLVYLIVDSRKAE